MTPSLEPRARAGSLPPAILRRALAADHHEIALLIDELRASLVLSEWDIAREAFQTLDQRLTAHLALEDDALLPILRRIDPEEARALAEDHGRIRTELVEIGVGLELHTARTAAIADFITALGTHALREDALLYRWSDTALTAAERDTLVGRLMGW